MPHVQITGWKDGHRNKNGKSRTRHKRADRRWQGQTREYSRVVSRSSIDELRRSGVLVADQKRTP